MNPWAVIVAFIWMYAFFWASLLWADFPNPWTLSLMLVSLLMAVAVAIVGDQFDP